MNQNTDYTPVALYARVSSDRQDVDLSIAAQLRALRDYAQKNGYIVFREYVDEAESGRIADRPEFRKMIDAATKPSAPFREILVWKFSRFTRKREHAVAFKSMLRRKGVRVVSITEHADDYPHRQADGGHHRERGRVLQRELWPRRSREGMRESASRGFWVSSHAPFGYNRVMVQDGRQEALHPGARPRCVSRVVKRMFDMAEAGNGMTLEIIQHPQQRGHLQPQGEALGKDQYPYDPHQRVLHGNSGLGHAFKGQRRASPGGEGVPRHRHQSPVQPRQQADALSRTPRRPIPEGSEAPICSADWSSARRATGRSAARTPRADSLPTTSASRS